MTKKERFLSKVGIAESGCWEWRAARFRSGYARYHAEDQVLAHRVAWILWKGAIPDGLCVCHHCDNRNCVNPEHLFLGTHLDNMRDMTRKGRGNRREPKLGERNPASIFTEADIRRMRGLYESGALSQHAIARRYGVAQGVISNIVNRKRWAHVA